MIKNGSKRARNRSNIGSKMGWFVCFMCAICACKKSAHGHHYHGRNDQGRIMFCYVCVWSSHFHLCPHSSWSLAGWLVTQFQMSRKLWSRRRRSNYPRKKCPNHLPSPAIYHRIWRNSFLISRHFGEIVFFLFPSCNKKVEIVHFGQ